MGGQREVVLPKAETEKSTGRSVIIGDIRIHESGGKVHFHSITNRCAVDLKDFNDAWRQGKDTLMDKPISMIGTNSKGEATSVTISMPQSSAKTRALAILIDVVDLSNFDLLNNFSMGK